MAQFSFLGTWNDSWDILTAILKSGEYSLIPDLLYEKPEPLFLTSLDDVVKTMLHDRPRTYLWSSKFSVLPIRMERRKAGEAVGTYWIDSTGGGPCIELTVPACYEEDGVTQLAPGMVSHPKWTINPETKAPESPSHELKMGYKLVKALIKRQLVRLKVRPDIWSGREASDLIEHNRARIHGFERPASSSTNVIRDPE